MQDGLDPTPGINNQFATIPDISVEAIANRVAPRQVASGVTRGIQQLGGENVYSDGGNSQIIVKDTVPRVLMGNQTSFGEGFYVSKSGIDATTNTDSAQWIFNSNQNVFKIVKTGTTTIPPYTVAASSTVWTSLTIPHGLGYVPILDMYAYVAFFYNTSYPALTLTTSTAYVAVPYNGKLGTLADTNINRYEITAGVDAANIYISWIYDTNAGTGYSFPAVPIKYYLRQETAT